MSLAVAVQAQTNSPGSQAAAPSSFEQFARELKQPVDWFAWGGDLRARNEYYDNIVSLTDTRQPLHEQDVVRYRGRVWASLLPIEGLSLNSRLSAEPREWYRPAFVSAMKGNSGMEWRYGIFDILNIKYTNAFQEPLSITAGRQDIAFGEYWNWWLVADGTPGDGSWSFFLDSVRLTWDIADAKTKLDLIYIYQNARPEGLLPTLDRSTDAYLTEQNEQGLILYASNKALKNTQLDGYLIYKRDDRELSIGDNGDIYTAGGRVIGNPSAHWQYSLEGAYQFGRKEDAIREVLGGARIFEHRDLDAFGANAHVSYSFQDALNNQAHAVFEYLSGDNPDTTGKDEMFDILWGRWPRFSEGYIYSYIQETGGRVAQLNNIERIGCGWSLTPIKKMTLSAYYNAWFAPEDVATRSLNPAAFSDNGHFRGHYLQAIVKHQFNKSIAAHLWSEFVWQGDYYRDQNVMDFLRAEVSFAF